MLYWYEKACREAGMDEEKIKELRRGYDKDYKRVKRKKIAKAEKEYTICFFSDLEAQCTSRIGFQLVDTETDVERDAIKKYELGRLREALKHLPKAEREFLLASFEADKGAITRLAQKHDMTRQQVYYYRDKLVADLQEKMGM